MILPTKPRSPRWRPALWGAAALLLALPWVAMQFSAEVRWSAGDFLVFGAMLAAACGGFEYIAGRTADRRLRWLAGAGIAVLFLLLWAELAVGLLA